MQLSPIYDLKLEQMFTFLRSALLKATIAGEIDDGGLPFSAALALQCFTNEYVFAEHDEEKKALEQLINVLYKGSLIQHIPDEINSPLDHEQKNPRNEAGHEVEIIKNTKLHKIVSTKKLKVNSAHHQSINRLGKNLIISATASHGVIEGIEHKNHRWCIGLQWHPEFLITKDDLKILKNFIENI